MEHQLKREIDEIRDDVNTLKRVVFGDSESKEEGMKQKVDEIHTILVQAKGIKGLFGTLILISATITVLKMWILK